MNDHLATSCVGVAPEDDRLHTWLLEANVASGESVGYRLQTSPAGA